MCGGLRPPHIFFVSHVKAPFGAKKGVFEVNRGYSGSFPVHTCAFGTPIAVLKSMRSQVHTHLTRSVFLSGVFLMVFAFGPNQAKSAEWATPKLERVSFSERSDGQGFVVRFHLSAYVTAHSSPRFLDDGSVEITLFRTSIHRRRQLDAPRGPVRSYRVDEINNDVVIKFEAADASFSASAYRDRGTDDVLLGINPTQSPQTPPVPPALSGTNTEPPIQNSGANADRWSLDTIIIDAGHGGQDYGAVARDGTREKDIVLSVAFKVGAYLEEKLGVNVVYTRDRDNFISLEGRGHLANQAGGKLFVSIHANAASDRRAKGTETFFLGLHKSDAAKSVMDRENEVIKFEDDRATYDGYDTMNAVVRTLAQSSYMRQSESLAESIESQFENRAGRNSRGVKQAGFYVLYGASMPAVLVELGFVTNPGEASFMKSRDGQAYLASAIFRAIKDYKIQYDKGLHLSVSNNKGASDQ